MIFINKPTFRFLKRLFETNVYCHWTIGSLKIVFQAIILLKSKSINNLNFYFYKSKTDEGKNVL